MEPWGHFVIKLFRNHETQRPAFWRVVLLFEIDRSKNVVKIVHPTFSGGSSARSGPAPIFTKPVGLVFAAPVPRSRWIRAARSTALSGAGCEATLGAFTGSGATGFGTGC